MCECVGHYLLTRSSCVRATLNKLLTICFQCTLSLPPENIRKPYVFLIFSGGRERLHWEQMC